MRRGFASILSSLILVFGGVLLNSSTPAHGQQTNWNGAGNLLGTPVSNGQWVQVGDVIWMQHTTQGVGSHAVHSSARILQPSGTVNTQTWDVTCNFSSNGGFGTGFSVTTAGWLQWASSFISDGGVPQGGDLLNLYILTSMPTGGGTSGCVSTLAASNIGVSLLSNCTGSFLPAGFIGTTATFQSCWSQPGFSSFLTVSNPAAGADWSVNLPAVNARACVLGVTFQLAASATVATRQVAIRLLSGATPQMFYIAGTGQTASQTIFYSFAPGTSANQQTLAGSLLVQTVPFNNGQPLCFNAGGIGSVSSFTGALQAGDQFSSIGLWLNIQQDNN